MTPRADPRAGTLAEAFMAALPHGRHAVLRHWLLAATLPLAAAALVHLVTDPLAAAADLAALAALVGASVLLTRGLAADAAGTRPALPFRGLAALAAGAGVTLAFAPAAGPAALVPGAVAAALHLAAFGTASPQRHAPAETARAHLAAIRATLARLGDAELEAAGQGLDRAVRRLLAALDRDPRALGRVRRHPGVILQGARDATGRLEAVWRSSEHGRARAGYLAFLAELEQSYRHEADALETALYEKMSLEIDVVREHLNNAGGAPHQKG